MAAHSGGIPSSSNNMEAASQYHQQQHQIHQHAHHQNLTSRLNIDPGLQSSSYLSHHPHQQQLPSPNYQQPVQWPINEANHCGHMFDKLRVQREQSRFADLYLTVPGRSLPFAAHRCVMAA